jgi:hypothetical protein
MDVAHVGIIIKEGDGKKRSGAFDEGDLSGWSECWSYSGDEV